jgi:hypothetical protein
VYDIVGIVKVILLLEDGVDVGVGMVVGGTVGNTEVGYV